jgi:hypothetical protein
VIQCIARAYARSYGSDVPLEVIVLESETPPSMIRSDQSLSLIVGVAAASVAAYERLPRDIAAAWLQSETGEEHAAADRDPDVVAARHLPPRNEDRFQARLRALACKMPPSVPSDTSAEIPEIVAATIEFARDRSERERDATCKLMHKAVEIAQWWNEGK